MGRGEQKPSWWRRVWRFVSNADTVVSLSDYSIVQSAWKYAQPLIGPAVLTAIWAIWGFLSALPAPIILLFGLIFFVITFLLFRALREYREGKQQAPLETKRPAGIGPIEIMRSDQTAKLDDDRTTEDLAVADLQRRRQLDVGSSFTRGLRGRFGPRPIPRRDASLSEALAYTCCGAWGVSLESIYTSQTEVDNFNYRLRELTKEFERDSLAVWGRERMMDAFVSDGWVLIEPEFWKKNKISWTSLFSGGATRTESRSGFGNDDQFQDLMVSKAEIEDRWPQ